MNLLKRYKKYVLAMIDVLLINFAYMAAFYFRYTWETPGSILSAYKNNALIITLVYLAVFIIFGLYRSLWTYASIDEFLTSITASFIGYIFCGILEHFMEPAIPDTLNLLAGVIVAMLVTGFRMSFRIYRRLEANISGFRKKGSKRVMIVGAGICGNTILREMKRHPEMKYTPAVFIDDSAYKARTRIAGVRVEGGRDRIREVAERKNIDEIIIAIPTLDNKNRTELINICTETGCKVKIIPGIYELIDGRVTLKQIRDVEVEDLLGRDPVKLDSKGIENYIRDKVVMVTGGGGSIGSELCRQIAGYGPRELLILDIYENNAYDLQNELRFMYPELKQRVLIASVRDKKRLDQVFKDLSPEVVFHAAAHKHVPLMEDNPGEAIKNNIFGTMNLAETADKYGAKKFVMISTDKAVNPTNIMGATKRACEMIVQAMDRISETEFVAVRFGNVLGSNGSVIPLFKKQIAKGGPVTVTHRDITRYFMTIPEASQLVLQAGAFAEGGEVFVLDMGKPVRIYDLACDLIRLSGFEPEKDIKIEVTGLRPGEKLYEELLMAEEGLGETKHAMIFVGSPTFSDMDELKKSFDEIRFAIDSGDREAMLKALKALVPTYNNGEVGALVETAASINM